jgi:phosphoribulokinase
MQTMTAQPTGFQLRSAAPAQLRSRAAPRCQARSSVRVLAADKQRTVLIGLAADSGCGKSTFMRRMTNLFGGNAKPPAGGNPDSNTLIRCALPLWHRALAHGPVSYFSTAPC